MRFVEDREAGWGVRLFCNLDAAPPGGKPPGPALPWSVSVKQVGGRITRRLERVEVRYRRGFRRRFYGEEAHGILREVQKNRWDAAG